MKQIIMLVCALAVSAYSFADVSSSGFAKGSPQLNALGSSWKAQSSLHAKKDPNDITIVYGGQDISNKPTIATVTATA